MNRSVPGLTVLMLTVAATAAASASLSLSERFAGASTITCEFPVMAVGDWTDGVPRAEVKRRPAVKLAFTAIDADEGRANMTGGFGTFHLIARLSGDTLHFIQSYREGALYVTSVFAEESRAGRVKAVHARHEYSSVALPGFTSRPEQYYGDCEITP